MNKRDIRRSIYLAGQGGNYRVHHEMPGEAIICYVPSVSIGNAIVRSLRERAYKEAASGVKK